MSSSANAGSITEFPIPDSNNGVLDIAAGPDGNLWFTGSKIGRMTTAGAISEFPLPTTNSLPERIPGITVGPDGNLWFTEPNNNKIGRITTSGAITELAIPTPNSTPTGIAAGPDGNLWFTEGKPTLGQIGRITTAGSITEYPAPPGTFTDITAGPDGNLWFTGSENVLGRITTSGVVTEFAPPGANCIEGITAGPDGNLWFTGCAGYIGRITPAGVITEFPLPSGGFPTDVVAGSDGNLWFTDSDRIGRITTGGAITEYSVPRTSSPQAITSGPDGNLWFAEGINRIGKITVSGQISQFPIPGVPSGIAAGPDGNLWFSQAAEMGRLTTAGVITGFPTPNNGTFGAGGPGVALGLGPDGAVSGPDGNVWFTEEGAASIGRITSAGAVVSFPVSTGAFPQDITAGPDGNLWFTDRGKIGRITTAGAITEFPIPTANSSPAGIAAGPDGNLWFTDEGAHQIGRITTSGVVTEFPVAAPTSEPVDIAAGPDGNLWFTQPFTGVPGQQITNQIGRITTAGTVTEFPIPTANSSPAGIAAGPDGNLWFTDQGANQIGQITTAGVITEFPIPTPYSGPVDIAAGPDGNLWFTEQDAAQIGRISLASKTATTTTLTSSVNPSVFGQLVALTATVQPASGSGVPTGTIEFTDGATSIGSAKLDTTGVGALTTGNLAVGTHALTAIYSGDTAFLGGSSAPALSQQVNQASTTTRISADVNPSVVGQTVMLTAAVSPVAPGAGTPTGTVTFTDGPTPLGTAKLDSSGNGTLSTSSLNLGVHSITAAYGGDGNFTASVSAPRSQTVNQAIATFTGVSSSPNPSVVGQAITVTASVSSAVPGTGTPTGSVTFADGSTSLGAATLDANATATLSVSTLTTGRHSITATYLGSTAFNGSKSAVLAQVVTATAATATALASDLNPSPFGRSLTLTATVTGSVASLGTPTGSVTFEEGSTVLGTGALDAGGRATFATSTLALGGHTLTAVYGGDTRFAPSASPSLTQNISPPGVLDLVSLAQKFQAGSPSGQITVQLEDLAGHPFVAGPNGMLVHLATNSAFGVFRDVGDAATITSITIPAGSSSASFLYRDTFAGTPTLTTSADPSTGLARATQIETVTGGPLDHMRLSPPQVTVALGAGQTYKAEGLDAFGNDLGNVTTSTIFTISPNGTCTGANCVVSTVGSHTVTGTDGTAAGTAVLVGDQAPVPSLVILNGSGVASHSVTFQISATYAGTTALTYTIDFGDGSHAIGSLPSADVTHTYTAACHACVVIMSVSDGIASPPLNAVGTVDITPNVALHAVPGDSQTVVLGTAAHLDGSNSTPAPPGITTYHWDFGDGSSADGPVQDHLYPGPAPHDWTATLTVTGSGTTNSAQVIVHMIPAPAAPGLTITVTGAGQPLVGASVVVEDAKNNIYRAIDRGGGSYHIDGLADGSYTAYGYAPGFIPGTASATIRSGTGSTTLALASGAVALTDLTTQRLTAAQAIALGIDPTAPGNENVYQFELHLAFIPGKPFDFTGIVSGAFFRATCNNCGGGWSPGGGFVGGGGSGFNLFASVNGQSIIWMIIPGKAKWLKEFFSVRLLITNLAPTGFVLQNGSATLNLPTGLSLADLNPGVPPQTLTKPIADIPGQGSQGTEWLIRGDTEGFYSLSADYSAVLQPVGAPARLHAETNAANQIHIWGGSALRMTVDADDHAYALLPNSWPYHVPISLTNVADVPVYNPLIELKPLPDFDPRRNYLFQPREAYDQGTDRIDPGATFTSRDYIVAPTFTGTLDLSQSFVLTTGGNSFVPSTLISHPALDPSTVPVLTAVQQNLTTHLDWQPIPGAVAYQVFTTPNFHQSFPDTPLIQVDGTVTSTLLPPAPYGEIAISTLVRGPDGALHNVLFHNLAAASGSQVPIPRITLTPIAASAAVGTSPFVTATVTFGNQPIVGTTVTLRVLDGPNVGDVLILQTDSNGHAIFNMTSAKAGTDVLQAFLIGQQASNTAQITFLAQDARAPQNVMISPENGRVVVTWQPPLINAAQVTTYTVIARPVDEGVHLDPANAAVPVSKTVSASQLTAALLNLVADCHQVYAITVRANRVTGPGFSSIADDYTTVRPSGILSSTGAPRVVIILLDGIRSEEPDGFYIREAADRGQNPGTKFGTGMNYCPEDFSGQPTSYRANPWGGGVFGDGMNRFMSKWNFEGSSPVSRTDGSYTNRFLLDPLAASGAVILPYSYTGAGLQRFPDGHVQFTFAGYGQAESTNNYPSVWVDELQTEIASVHQVWGNTPIVVIGHSQGGFLAEQYWERKVHDRIADGVSQIFSLDSPINGIAAATLLSPAPILTLWGQLWSMNFPASSPQGQRDRFLSGLDGRKRNVFRPIGTPFDPTYSGSFSIAGGYDLGAPGMLSQVFVDSAGACMPDESCPTALAPSFASPPQCDVTQADLNRHFIKYDGSEDSNTGHFVVKYCPAVVAYVKKWALGSSQTGGGGPPVIALGNAVLGPTSAAAGTKVRVTGYGFEPGSVVHVSLPADSITLGSFTADASGWLDVVVRIPRGVASGGHIVVADGVDFDGSTLKRLGLLIVK